MTLAPGVSIIEALRAHPGEPLTLEAGKYDGGVLFGWSHPILILGTAGTVISGGLTFGSCGPIDLAHFDLSGAPSHGLHAALNASLRLRDLRADHCGGNGFLLGTQSSATLEDLHANGNHYHGIYVSEGGSHVRIAGCTSRKNRLAGIWINGNPGRIYDVTVEDNDCGKNGTGAIALASVSHGRISGNHTAGGKFGVSLFDDDSGPAHLVHDLDLRKQAGRIKAQDGCTGILLPA